MTHQAMLAADPADVHRTAMAISDEDATKLYARIRLDGEAWRELQKYRASLKVRNFRSQVGVSWMFDGMEYPQDTADRKGPLLPDEEIWVPLIIAKYGVRNSASWEYEVGYNGEIINKQDFTGPQIPMIRILEIRNPGDFGTQVKALTAPKLAPCSLCNEEFQPHELAAHMIEAHAAELAQAAAPKAPATSKAKRRVEEWAARQAQSGGTQEPTEEPEAG